MKEAMRWLKKKRTRGADAAGEHEVAMSPELREVLV